MERTNVLGRPFDFGCRNVGQDGQKDSPTEVLDEAVRPRREFRVEEASQHRGGDVDPKSFHQVTERPAHTVSGAMRIELVLSQGRGSNLGFTSSRGRTREPESVIFPYKASGRHRSTNRPCQPRRLLTRSKKAGLSTPSSRGHARQARGQVQ